MTNDYHVRLPLELRQKFQESVPWGFQVHVVEELMKQYISLAKEFGDTRTAALLLSGHIQLKIVESENVQT